MPSNPIPDDLGDLLAAVDALDAPSPPRRKRTLAEFCAALDQGNTDRFFLDDFDDTDQRQLARHFGVAFRDGSPYHPPEAREEDAPDQDATLRPAPVPPTAPEPPSSRTGAPAAPEPAAAAPRGPLGGFALPPDKLSRLQNTGALFLDLRIAPATPEAAALTDDLVERLEDAERRRGVRQRKRRPSAQRQLRDSVGALAGGLLRAWAENPPAAVYRSRDVNTFAAKGISWRAFLGALKAMERLGLVLRRGGGKAKDKPAGWAARYWPDVALLRAAAEHGIGPSTVRAAFRHRPAPAAKAPKVKEPLRFKAFKRHPNGRPPLLPVDFTDPVAATLRAEVEAMNAFAAATPVEGCLPPRWSRLFIGDFRLFGRLCAAGCGNYQSLPAAERLERIRIAGEPVAEIDIRASLLSFLHGLPLPEGDLYALPGIPREVAKAWVNATLGKGTPVSKWSADALRAVLVLNDHPAPAVMAAALARYPFLAEPSRVAEEFRHVGEPRRVLIHMLMGVEADVVMDTLQALRAEGVLGLPMHDGIIVPASAEEMACRLLRMAGERVAGVGLRLKVDRPTPQ